MAYTPDPTDATQPTEEKKAKSAAEEFREMKAYLNGVVAAGLPSMTGNKGKVLTVSQTGSASWQSNAGNDIAAYQNFI